MCTILWKKIAYCQTIIVHKQALHNEHLFQIIAIMTNLSKVLNTIKVGALLICAAIAPFHILAVKTDASGARWTYHTTFDNQPRKIIDTPDATYFFVHQHYYNTGIDVYKVPAGGLFYYDKSNPDAGIVDMQRVADLSGAHIHLAEYNPAGKYLLVAYSDGDIDIVDANQKVANISTVKGHRYPRMSQITSVTFDKEGSDTWVTTQAGFVHIDGASGRLAHLAIWGKKVNAACRLGNRYVAAVDGVLNVASATDNPAQLDSYKSVAGTSAIAALMPLTDDIIAYITTNGDVKYVKFNGMGASAPVNLISDNSIRQTTASTIAVNAVDHTVQRTAHGWMINGSTASWQILPPAEGASAPTTTKINHTDNKTLYAASWNFKDFWFYVDRGSFVKRSLADNASWNPSSAPMRPAAPMACITAQFDYSPNHGFVASNGASKWATWNNSRLEPALISTYRNGRWENKAPAYATPYIIDSNASLANTFYSSVRQRFPVSDPDGFAIDPLYPDWLHIGSLNDGFAAVNLADPRMNPIMHTDSQNPLCGFTAIKDLPNQTKQQTGTHIMGFDADNNLWMFRSNFKGSNPGDIYLWVWTPEDRKEALTTGDYTKADNWIKIQYPLGAPSSWTMDYPFKYGVACKHPANKNKLLLYLIPGQPLIVYDHKGTLNDTSDDEIKLISEFYSDRSGHRTDKYFTYDLKEDPITGRILMFDFNFAITFDINDPVDSDGGIQYRSLTGDELSTDSRASLDTHNGSRFDFDEYGRIWVSQGMSGVSCISADRKKVVYRWSYGNSPLPSGFVYSCGWNPDTKSVFLSTDCGLVEVQPELLADIDVANTEVPFATPAIVTSDYTGTVALYNLPRSAGVRVVDASGKQVRTLHTSADGTSSWDLLSDQGKRVAPGRYLITDPSLSFADIEIIVAR